MKREGRAVRIAVAAAVVAALGSGALAQDTTGQVPPDERREGEATPTAEERYPVVRASSLTTMPGWEAFGTGYPETVEETFFRLAQDFAVSGEVNVRRLGEVPIWPRGDLRFGPIRLLPYLRQAVEYESNFYKQDSTGNASNRDKGRESAWTHVNQAGLLADTTLMGGRLRIAGSADARWNVRYDSDKPDTWELDTHLGASYRFPSSVWIRSGVSYERRSDPINAAFTSDFDRSNWDAFLNLGADRDVLFGTRFRYEVGASIHDANHREAGLEHGDRTETSYYGKLSYPFWRDTTRLFGRVRYRDDNRESDRINDGEVWGFDAGIEGHIPLREGEYRGLRGQVSVGFDYGSYDDDQHQTGSTRAINDSDSHNGSLNVQAVLQYLVSPRTTVDLRLLRQTQFSFYGNYQIVDRADLTFTHNISACLVGRASAFVEHADPSGNIPNDTALPRASRGQKAPHTTRGGVGVGLRYRINEWMDVDWSYDYERRNSSLRPYTNHRSILGVTFYLNALKPAARSTTPF